MTMKSLVRRRYRFLADLQLFRATNGLGDDLEDYVFRGVFPEDVADLVTKSEGRNTCSWIAKITQQRRKTSTAENNTVTLSGNAFQAEFECGPFDCAAVLSKEPRVVVEMLLTKNSMDTLIGIASISLAPLAANERLETWASIFKKDSSNTTVTYQSEQLGEIFVKIALEDLAIGCESSRTATTSPAQQISTDKQAREEFAVSAKRDVEWELEKWKNTQKEQHLQSLKQMELERMYHLELEWRKHEEKRENDIQSLKAKLQDQIQQVTSSLRDTEEREKKVIVFQESLTRRRKDLERQHASKMQEVDEIITRLQKDFEHHLSIEQDRVKEASSKSTQLKQQLRSSENNVELLTAEIAQLKKSNVQTNALLLQEELESFKKLHNVAQERISVLEEEKNRYKTRVMELAEELGTCKRAGSDHVQSTTIGTQIVQPTVEDVEALKEELNSLKIQTQNQRTVPDQPTTLSKAVPSTPTTSKDNEITQILTNRRELIATGIYNENDELIQELDARITHLKNNV